MASLRSAVPRRGPVRRALAAAVLIAGGAAALPGCAQPTWEPVGLERRYPELREIQGHRLADVRPYYWPAGGELTLLLCRWPDGARIPVVLPPEASADERHRLQAALAAWEQAGLGIRFVPVPALTAGGIEIELVEGMLSWGANTIADCAIDSAASGDPLPARMVYASVQLARGDPRLVGSALHELGHALGFQGHPRRGASIMVRDAGRLRKTGDDVLKGAGFADATLSALYAVPSGTVLARIALVPGQTDPIDRLRAVGSLRGWQGPFLRAGDREGLVRWERRRGGDVTVLLRGLSAALDRPERLVIEPGPAARRILE